MSAINNIRGLVFQIALAIMLALTSYAASYSVFYRVRHELLDQGYGSQRFWQTLDNTYMPLRWIYPRVPSYAQQAFVHWQSMWTAF